MNARILARIVHKSRDLVEQIAENKHWHLSFLVRKNAILSIGFNRPKKTSGMAYKFGELEYPYIHAECDCLSRAACNLQDLKKCTLVNVRLAKRGGLLLSRPCNNCAKIIASLGVGRVLYSNSFSHFEEMIY